MGLLVRSFRVMPPKIEALFPEPRYALHRRP